MVEIIEFKGKFYPKFQAEGNAARFAIPFALQVCKGSGFDIGYAKEEWKFPGAIGIDLVAEREEWRDPYNLPAMKNSMDYIFSSHCLEHLSHWVNALEHWATKLKPGGTLFLYLPEFSQTYWRPWNNRKHIHCFTPDIIRKFLLDSGIFKSVFVSERDLNNSFMAIAEKI